MIRVTTEVMRHVTHVEISGRIWNIMVLSIIWTVVNSASAQQTPPGFISIDCGSATQHKDSVTNLTWETDGKYIIPGMNGILPNLPDSNASNYEALGTFKYFFDPQSKYCYELPLTRRNVSVLIRAMFLHGNSPLLALPITFKVYVSATLWNSVGYYSGDDLYTPKVIEGIFYSPGSTIYLCLVPDHGVPFISTLELRQLDPEGIMYSLSNRQTQALSSLVRYSLGVSDGSTVRYPDDSYDRLWTSSAGNFLSSSSLSQKENANTSSSLNNVPPRVMMGAYVLSAGALEATSPVTLPLATAISYVSAIFYCEAINNVGGVDMFLSLNQESTESFDVTNVPVMKHLEHVGLLTNSVQIGVSSLTASGAIINSMEIYEEIISYYSDTNAYDENLTNFVKTTFNLSYWQGDPCVPVPYDWITCTYGTYQESWAISSLNLSKLNNSARLRNAPFIAVSTLSSMTSMTVTDSLVDDSTFRFFIENFTANSAQLSYLNLSYNNITTFPSVKSWSTTTWGPRLLFDLIDLSHNSFSGKVLSFSTFTNPDGGEYGPTSLTKLNLSYNLFSSFPNSWGNSSHGLFNLTLLDLSHNFISSDFSPLNDLLRRNPLLEELHLSDNILTGGFPSDLYFSKQNLKLVNVTRNKISGSLNLTAWYQQLKHARNDSSLLDGQLFSFTYNDISDIIPGTNIFQPVIIEFLKSNDTHFNRSGVLLWGNPYCKVIKSLTQGYLCRNTVNDIVYDIRKKKANVGLILGTTLGGLALFLFSSIIIIITWRLWRQLSITSRLLREVQQELTNRKVQPPFYSYHDLKVATRSFHEDNKLGSGAFGAVYKGTLSDGSVIAVKRLFNFDKVQVLNEFLSEVALISGLKHKHLIQLKGCCIKNEERILVYEFASNGNLAESLWVHGDGTTPELFAGDTHIELETYRLDHYILDQTGKHMTPLDWTHRLNIAEGVARGLSYLHEELQPRIIHRDIKAANVLLDDNFNARIADFGLAKSFAEEETQAAFTVVAGTRGYFAPEYVLDGQLTTKADVFSFGILLLEIMTGRRCIDSTLPPDRVYIKTWAEDLEKAGKLVELLQPELRGTTESITIIKIALSCIRTNPKFRPEMSQVVVMLLGNLNPQNFLREGEGSDEDTPFKFDSSDEGTSSGMKSEEVALLKSQSFPLSMLGKSGTDSAYVPALQLSRLRER